MLNKREIIAGGLALVFAPAIVRASSLMSLRGESLICPVEHWYRWDVDECGNVISAWQRNTLQEKWVPSDNLEYLRLGRSPATLQLTLVWRTAVMRKKLTDRRYSENMRVSFETAQGHEIELLITVGFDDSHCPREVFCDDFKEGSDLHAVVMDACILLSRLLQHGDSPAELFASMCSPPSMIGTIARAIACEAQAG